MTTKQYRRALEELGLSQARAAEWLGISIRADPRTDGKTASLDGATQTQAGGREVNNPTMKRTISTLAILGALILPAQAGETPSKADMLKGLLVVGVYTRLCATPLSEAEGPDPYYLENDG